MRMAAPVDQAPPYAAMVHAALRGLVRSALQHAATHGLSGEHHFYLTFRTDHPGVAIPARLVAQYPEEITIVLQHQFWDLKVQDDEFSVGLSFGGVPAALTVPYDALTGFADPAMQSNPFADVALMVDKERGFALRVPPVGGQHDAAVRIGEYLAVHQDARVLRPHETGNGIDEGGFAGTRGAEDGGQPSRRLEVGNQREAALRVPDGHRKAHEASLWPTRRAISSDAIRAPSEMATEMAVRRRAAASPPGTWVKL